MTEGKLEFSESESHHREKPKHSTSHDMAAHNCISPGTSYALRGEIADAIREYCHSVSPAAVQMSHGVERIYYAGISLNGLTDAIFAALGACLAQPSTSPGTEHRSQHLQMRDAINNVELALSGLEIDGVARLFEGSHDSVMVKFPLGAVRQLANCYPELNRIINDPAFERKS